MMSCKVELLEIHNFKYMAVATTLKKKIEKNVFVERFLRTLLVIAKFNTSTKPNELLILKRKTKIVGFWLFSNLLSLNIPRSFF